MTYKFKGFDWTELAECWGIKVKEEVIFKELPEFKSKESVEVTKFINGTRMTFEVKDEEEVLAEKIKIYIWDNISGGNGEFKDEQVREDIHNFLRQLIRESKISDYNYPVYEGMLKLESDHALAKWVTSNLEKLWT